MMNMKEVEQVIPDLVPALLRRLEKIVMKIYLIKKVENL